MKKVYIKPVTEIVIIHSSGVLCLSGMKTVTFGVNLNPNYKNNKTIWL